MSPADINPVQAAELVRRGLMLADQATVSDIECGAVAIESGGERWYDVRPMLDEREHSLPVVDMATEALQYALMRGLVHRHPGMPHLVRIARQGSTGTANGGAR